MIRTVVVPVDQREEGERSLPVAVRVAAALGASVELVTVDSPGADVDDLRRYHRHLARGVADQVTVRSEVVRTANAVAEVLVDRVEGRAASLLCMATHARSALGGLLLGSVAEAVVRASARPVLLVGPSVSHEGEGPTVVGAVTVAALDGSALDEGVVEAAGDWCEAVGGPLLLTHVVTSPRDEVAMAEGQALLRHWAGEARRRRVEEVRTDLVTAGDPGPGVLSVVGPTTGVLVVGSHRRQGLGRLALGSDALRLTHTAPCPVLVMGHVVDGDTAGSPSRAAV